MPTLEVGAVPAQRLRCEGPRWSVLLAGLRHPIRFAGRLIRSIQQDNTLTLAAALSYYFFFSFFPFLLFVLALVSLLPIHGLDDWILAQGARVIPGEAYAMVEKAVRGILRQPRGGLVSLGAVLALWGASSAFVGMIDGLNRAYKVPESRPWWRVRLQAIALTVGLSVFMIVAFVLALFGGPVAVAIGRYFGPTGVVAALVIRWALVLAMISMVIATIYWAAPDVEQEWEWVTPGSVVFTVGFGLASGGFSLYVSRFGAYDKTYGSLGAVIILLFWMYLLATFILLGGEVNALLEHMSPAGKSEGEKTMPPPRAEAERIARTARAPLD